MSRLSRRLLLLCTDLEIGGTPTVVRELALRLRRAAAGVAVEVACLSRMGPVGAQLLDAGIPVTALDATGPADVGVFARFARFARKRRFDTILSFLVHANVVAAAARPWGAGGAIRWLQSIQTTQPWPRWHWLAQAAAQFAADRIIVPSASVAQAARDWSFVPEAKIVVVPNAIDPSEFAGLAPPRVPVASPAGAAFPIGFVGRLDPVKRLPDLLRAVELLDGAVHLHIFGEGPQRGEIERAIARQPLSSRATLHGATRRVQDALGSIGLLVLPSQAEGFGLVLIEAMAAGVPVLATDVPGIRDVVRDGYNGLLVPAGSPAALAQAIERLVAHPPLRAALAQRALRDVRQRFSWDRILPQYLELFC